MRRLIIFTLFALAITAVKAEGTPEINPKAIHYLDDGTEVEVGDSSVNAPYEVYFFANPSNIDDYTVTYEWRFYKSGDTESSDSSAYLVRYDEDMTYTFMETGTYTYYLTATLSQGSQVVSILKSDTKSLTIKESELIMPNAFSPNGDGFNDVYKPKQYQSLTEFHAYIYNRWGQLLYDWTDPSTGWDGTYKGKACKDGVYFCLVKAKGSDGEVYNIKTDVNLLTGFYSESETGTTE